MYGLGQAAEGIKNYAFESFLFFYYNQVLGLSGKLTGHRAAAHVDLRRGDGSARRLGVGQPETSLGPASPVHVRLGDTARRSRSRSCSALPTGRVRPCCSPGSP